MAASRFAVVGCNLSQGRHFHPNVPRHSDDHLVRAAQRPQKQSRLPCMNPSRLLLRLELREKPVLQVPEIAARVMFGASGRIRIGRPTPCWPRQSSTAPAQRC
jgi:hypothetical protein